MAKQQMHYGAFITYRPVADYLVGDEPDTRPVDRLPSLGIAAEGHRDRTGPLPGPRLRRPAKPGLPDRKRRALRALRPLPRNRQGVRETPRLEEADRTALVPDADGRVQGLPRRTPAERRHRTRTGDQGRPRRLPRTGGRSTLTLPPAPTAATHHA